MTKPSPLTLEQLRQSTLATLEAVDDSYLEQVSHLTLPEVSQLREEVAAIIPAGRLPGMILSGLVNLKGQTVSAEQRNLDLQRLFLGVMSAGLYGTFVAGPAAILAGYQKLLRLAGKDAEQAFPEGTWQFYLEFGLREDSARHASETVGFQRAVRPNTPEAIRATAWIWALMQLYFDYDDILAGAWRERVAISLLERKLADLARKGAAPPDLRREWQARLPYRRGADARPGESYAAYHHRAFNEFWRAHLAPLKPGEQRYLESKLRQRQSAELSAYQAQMSLLQHLVPGLYREEHAPIPLWRARVAFVWRGRTYLFPVCWCDDEGRPLVFPRENSDRGAWPLRVEGDQFYAPLGVPAQVDRSGRVQTAEGGLGRLRPAPPTWVLSHVAAILSDAAPQAPPGVDTLLVNVRRARQDDLRALLPVAAQTALAQLSSAPVILNWDAHDASQPLALIRRGQRGIGSHALTILRTPRSFVFDQSHLFFDGTWGMAVAEILTDEAISACRGLEHLRPVRVRASLIPLDLRAKPEWAAQWSAHSLPGETSAEVRGIALDHIRQLRDLLRRRHRALALTVNDFLILGRTLQAAHYEPSPRLAAALSKFREEARAFDEGQALAQVEAALTAARSLSPALLIPMDASWVEPRQRVFPTTFRNWLTGDMLQSHRRALDAYQAYNARPLPTTWRAFEAARRDLLGYLRAFGQILHALKDVTMRGQSFSTATIKMLAHLPAGMQHFLDQIPQRIGVLNEVIKGDEVFSNAGRVAPGSTLTRFISAKDDGQAKQFVWGILTDDNGQMTVTLRDFRPHVEPLLRINRGDLAYLITQDYVDAYVAGINRLVDEWTRIVVCRK
jgi:hypothetical protein